MKWAECSQSRCQAAMACAYPNRCNQDSLATPPSLWRPSPCRLNGFHVWLLERQTGPCLRDDYEFARAADGSLLEFRNRQECQVACNRVNEGDLFAEAA